MSTNRLHVQRIHTVGFVGKGDDPAAEIVISKRMDVTKATKTEDGAEYPPEAFAYVPDPDKPSTWKLRLWESPDLKLTARQVGMTVAALGAGFRGQRVQIPSADLPGVKNKVLAAWKETHDAEHDEIPEALMHKSTSQEKGMDKLPTLTAVLKALGFAKEDVANLKPEDLANGLDGASPALRVEKSADVIALEKAVSEAQDRATKAEALAKRLEDEHENQRYITKAQQFKHTPGVTADDFGPILRKCADALGADFAKLEQVLKAGDEAARQAALYEEIGSDAPARGSAEAEVSVLAKEIKKAEPKLSDGEARARVWKGRPDLMNRYEDERKARAALRGATNTEE